MRLEWLLRKDEAGNVLEHVVGRNVKIELKAQLKRERSKKEVVRKR